MALLFKTLFRFVIACLPRSKCLNFVAAVTTCSSFGAQEKKICHCFHLSLIYLPHAGSMGQNLISAKESLLFTRWDWEDEPGNILHLQLVKAGTTTNAPNPGCLGG